MQQWGWPAGQAERVAIAKHKVLGGRGGYYYWGTMYLSAAKCPIINMFDQFFSYFPVPSLKSQGITRNNRTSIIGNVHHDTDYIVLVSISMSFEMAGR